MILKLAVCCLRSVVCLTSITQATCCHDMLITVAYQCFGLSAFILSGQQTKLPPSTTLKVCWMMLLMQSSECSAHAVDCDGHASTCCTYGYNMYLKHQCDTGKVPGLALWAVWNTASLWLKQVLALETKFCSLHKLDLCARNLHEVWNLAYSTLQCLVDHHQHPYFQLKISQHDRKLTWLGLSVS